MYLKKIDSVLVIYWDLWMFIYIFIVYLFIFTIFFCTSIYLFFSSLCIDDEAKQKNMCVSGYMLLKIRVVRKDFSFINLIEIIIFA